MYYYYYHMYVCMTFLRPILINIILFQVDLKPSLLPNAVPRIFKGVPDYLSKPTAETRPSPSKRRNMVHERNKAEQDDWLESDLIGTYDHMISSIADHLTVNHPSMISKKCGDHILLYKLENIEDKYHSSSYSIFQGFEFSSISLW